MKRRILIVIFILLSFILCSCALNKYNDVTYKKNHDYYYMSNEEYMKYHYHYDIPLNKIKK